MKYDGSTTRENYVLHVWNLYSKHFLLFLEATQNAFDIFKASLTIGSAPAVIVEDNYMSDTMKQTKSELLKIKLTEFGFFKLPKIKNLKLDNQILLIEKMVLKGIPYTIAMFEYLDFFQYLDREHFSKIADRNLEIADWFNTDERSIRGNKNVLDKGTTENKKRYTSHIHKEKVIEDYELLK